ncbi:MAG: hypothetical protein LBQ59_00365 [Candidatus Peribacteria bacterium]|nr:hypothetical protein [Candidatus Peribacteria bacterium]
MKENIDKDIFKDYFLDKNYNIDQVFEILTYLQQNDLNNSQKAKISMEHLYKGILNPKEEFKNKEIVYRI